MKIFSRRTALKSILGATISLAMPAFAQDAWPSKPVTLVVPFAPGGTTDIIARIVGKKISESLHQAVLVENRSGAGGTIGGAHVAHSNPDGYTFLLATVAHTMAPNIYKKLPYDFMKDLDPIGLVAMTPNVLLVNSSIPVKSVPELIAYIKAHPQTVNYGSAGPGSTEHFSGAMFRAMTGTDITHIPYKGGAPMMTDLMSGQIQMAIETSPSASSYIRTGKVKALAVTTKTRSKAYSSLPTLDEVGVKGYEVTTWFALMAPHGTPAAIEQRASAELAKVMKQPDVEKIFEQQGVVPGDMGPPALASFIIRSQQLRRHSFDLFFFPFKGKIGMGMGLTGNPAASQPVPTPALPLKGRECEHETVVQIRDLCVIAPALPGQPILSAFSGLRRRGDFGNISHLCRESHEFAPLAGGNTLDDRLRYCPRHSDHGSGRKCCTYQP